MKNTMNKYWLFILIAFLTMPGWGNSAETKKTNQNPAVSTNQVQSVVPAASTKKPAANDVAVSVDGKILKKSEVEKELKGILTAQKDKIPADRIKEAEATIKQQLMDEFIARTLLTKELEKRKIGATDKEINAQMEQIKSTLPPDTKLETLMKENKFFKENVILNVKVGKLISLEAGNKAKPSPEEISKFYNENTDKFNLPENAHVRHLLIAFAEGDSDKVKAEKKVKIEDLRKQIVGGADFAEVAKKNSDCPSKGNGGDLGNITKGQTVKPFEDAAFSQEIKAIGPVVTTEFGYHVIQVLERNPQKIVALEEAKEKIASFLEMQKKQEVFKDLITKLRNNAKVVFY